MSLPEMFTTLALNFFMEFIRYFIAAGIVFLLIWEVYRERLMHRVIQKKLPPKSRLQKEFMYSVSSAFIFAVVGLFIVYFKDSSQLYYNMVERGWWYFALCFPLVILIHDAYFYWTHRLMHHPLLYKRVHLVHHQSTNPSPWAAYSFHPFEAVVQAGIAPLLIFCIPLHPVVMVFFAIYQITYNVVGHSSFEIFPKGFTRNRWMFWHNTVTHHNMHHRYFTSNFSIYFNWWDRIGGTMHPKYDEQFEEVTGRPRIQLSVRQQEQLPEPAGAE